MQLKRSKSQKMCETRINVCEFEDLEFTFNAIPIVNFNLSKSKLHAIREHRGTWAVGVGAHRGL